MEKLTEIKIELLMEEEGKSSVTTRIISELEKIVKDSNEIIKEHNISMNLKRRGSGACPRCNGNLIWQSDFDFEDYMIDGEGIVSNYICCDCDSEITVYSKF